MSADPHRKAGLIRDLSSTARRRLLLSVALVMMAIITAVLFARADFRTVGVDDFVEYWSAGRLNLQGGNPYSQTELLRVQRAQGWDGELPVMMWNPPHTLTFVMPFASLPYGFARKLWLLVSIAVILIASDRLWRLYGGSPAKRAFAPLLAAAFMPTLAALKNGQITALLLAGVAGFLCFAHRGRWLAAGCFLVLVAIKPHVVYLIWVALGLWWIRRPQWRLVSGSVLFLGISWLISTMINPDVTSQYLEAVLGRPPLYWRTMTWGSALRMAFSVEREWLQLVAPGIGCCWLLYRWFERGKEWNWTEEMPRLILVSTSTMAFGWPFDLTVLLPAVIQAGVWMSEERDSTLRRRVLTVYVALQGLAVAMNQALLDAIYFIWLSPALLLLYSYYAARRTRPADSSVLISKPSAAGFGT